MAILKVFLVLSKDKSIVTKTFGRQYWNSTSKSFLVDFVLFCCLGENVHRIMLEDFSTLMMIFNNTLKNYMEIRLSITCTKPQIGLPNVACMRQLIELELVVAVSK